MVILLYKWSRWYSCLSLSVFQYLCFRWMTFKWFTDNAGVLLWRAPRSFLLQFVLYTLFLNNIQHLNFHFKEAWNRHFGLGPLMPLNPLKWDMNNRFFIHLQVAGRNLSDCWSRNEKGSCDLFFDGLCPEIEWESTPRGLLGTKERAGERCLLSRGKRTKDVTKDIVSLFICED